MQMITPMGWYPDPQIPGTERYWTGERWTNDTRPAQAPGTPTGAARPVASAFMVSDKSSKNVQAMIAWGIAIVTVGYMLPWAIAASRGKSNAGAICVLNLLLGWTVVGWIVALVMACGAHQQSAVRI